MKNDKFEINENILENVNGGVMPIIYAGLETDNINKISASHDNLPKKNSDEKYIMADAVPTAAEIISELKS